MDRLVCRIKDHIQPFERQLAFAELRALSKGKVLPVNGDEATASMFQISEGDPQRLRHALAYWHSIGTGEGLTAQLRGEATSIIARNGLAIDELEKVVRSLVPSRLPNKRCLRYGTHGLHEYRGKFFPQLVRALINIAQVPEGGLIVDPMCGSGTTVVEAVLSGRSSFGVDMNPLSVFMAQVKCKALSLTPSSVVGGYELLRSRVEGPRLKSSKGGYFASLPERDQEYLGKWFSSQTLKELDCIQEVISGLRSAVLRDLYRLCLSNILRAISWQKEDDLRVRKEKKQLEKGEVLRRFLSEAHRSSKLVAAYLVERSEFPLGSHSIIEGDARYSDKVLNNLTGSVDAIITSPPYATALPYLDTDRLSLIYLGLLPRADHRTRDTLMIGNREITDRVRNAYWREFEKSNDRLPECTRELIQQIETLNGSGIVGFRRRNLAALLSKYFFDMKEVLQSAHKLLKRRGSMFLVVGNNRTTAGGKHIEIRTAEHLEKMAEDLGFSIGRKIPMEMLVSRDIFKKNAMASETILVLKKA